MKQEKIPDKLLGKIIAAARLRDRKRLLALVQRPEANLLRSDRALHRELAWALFYTVGANAARLELEDYLGSLPPDSAPAAEVRNLLFATRLTAEKSAACNDMGVPMQHDSLPALQVSVNNHPATSFLVDTGASHTLLSRSYAARSGLTIIDGEEGVPPVARNQIPLSVCRVSQFRLGDLELGPQLLRVGTLPPQVEAAGLLSPFSTLDGCWWELDFADGWLRVHSGPITDMKAWKRASLYWDRGNVFVRARLDGRRGFFLLDTGAGGMVVTPEFAESIGIAAGPERQTFDMQGSTTVRSAGSHRFRLGASEIESEIFLADFATDSQDLAPLPCAGFVGMPWFRRRRILVPPDQKHLYFTDVL